MANEEHVKRLRQGVAEWNAWRDENRSIVRPSDANLSSANLSGAKLSGADFSDANLNGANLSSADLSNANLRDTDVSRANLSGAYLGNATLIRTNLREADLSGAHLAYADLTDAFVSRVKLVRANLGHADLRYAHLHYADLTDANLSLANLSDAYLCSTKMSGANLTKTTLGNTVFGYVNLTGVIGLDTSVHFGPSIIDYQTLQISKSLPLPFLRGVGLPDGLIEYLPSLLNQPIQFYSCFISYSSTDQDFADRINADLQNQGVRCWFAPHDMPIGGKILDEIDAAIRLRDKVLLILSEHSIKSDWVEDEVSKAFAEERKRGQTVLFPLRLDDAVMDTCEAWAVKLRDQRNIGDFRRWKDHDGYKMSFERVLRDLKRAASTE